MPWLRGNNATHQKIPDTSALERSQRDPRSLVTALAIREHGIHGAGIVRKRGMRAEVFFLIERPKQRLDAWINALAAIDAPRAPKLAAVVAYYDAGSDIALLAVHYDARAFDDGARRYLVDVALAAKVGMIQPDQLSDDERRRFLDARLARCRVRLAPQPSLLVAVTELLRAIVSRRAHTAKPPPLPPPRRRDRAVPKPPPLPAPRTLTLPACNDEDLITSPIDLVAFQAMTANAPPRIQCGYLRGGRWLAARVGGISLADATLLTGAVPRLNDPVDVAFAFGEHRAIVRGTVAKLSTRSEAAARGAAAFTLRFLLDEHSRPQLTALLVAARAAQVAIEPPPRRGSRRFPVEWLVALGVGQGFVQATALDVSVRGMFVHPDVPLSPDATASFSLVIDDGGPPIAGRAKVMRRISDAEAKAYGLVAGFGLSIVDMVDADRTRWLGFLARIERRVEKRVLIGAQPGRFADLRAGLSSLGYAVHGGIDPEMLVHLANTTRPADAVLIDGAWLQDGASTAIVEDLLASRHVPCVRMRGEAVEAREAIDRLLDVV